MRHGSTARDTLGQARTHRADAGHCEPDAAQRRKGASVAHRTGDFKAARSNLLSTFAPS